MADQTSTPPAGAVPSPQDDRRAGKLVVTGRDSEAFTVRYEATEKLDDIRNRLLRTIDDLQAHRITPEESVRIAKEAEQQLKAEGADASLEAQQDADGVWRVLKDLEDRLPPSTVTRKRSRLTDKAVQRLRPPERGRLQVPDAHQPGLWLRITETGGKSWSVAYRLPGRKAPQRYTIGKWPTFGVAEARKMAREVLSAVHRGEDPQAAKRARRHVDGDGFESVAEEWLKRKVRGRIRSAADVEAQVARLVEAWGSRPIGSIGRPDVLRLLDGIMDRGHGRTANKLLGTIRRLFTWAIERGNCDADPTRGITPPGLEKARDRTLTEAELAAVWRGAEELGWPWSPVVRLLILTAQRRTEVAAVRWSEIDLDRRMWTIPGERAKNGKAHDVPLSDAAVEILAALPRFAHAPDLVFPSRAGTPVSTFAQMKRRLDELSGVTGWTLHDLRRTAATGMARIGVQPHIVGEVLGHTAPGVTRQHYNRYSYAREKAEALGRWAAYVIALVEGEERKVVAIRT